MGTAEVENAIDEKTRAIYCETITNPGLVVADISGLGEIAKSQFTFAC